MRAVDIIAKKRDGEELTRDEITFMVQGYARDEIPDYQMSAWAMAVLLKDMTARETADLTLTMVASGETLDLHHVAPLLVDKHSTGGVGDKTTLVVAPLVAATGLPVAKMSGRGLGFTGGTLDKLESIPGFRTELSLDAFMDCLRACGVVVAGQTADLVPADGKLYALRDVTATVPSLPLIASSIMSKKIAGGADAIVLDVKVGRGALMETLEEARALAERMMQIGRAVGRRVTAVLSDMSQPLGQAVGNALEVAEAIEALRGGGPEDLREHCLGIAAEMLLLGGKAQPRAEALEQLVEVLESGQALERFCAWIAAQGGDPHVAHDPTLLPRAPVIVAVPSPQTGYIERIDAREVGLVSVAMGAGRERKGERIDPAVGIMLGPKVGEWVERGAPLLTLHASDRPSLETARERLLRAYAWSAEEVLPPAPFHDILR